MTPCFKLPNSKSRWLLRNFILFIIGSTILSCGLDDLAGTQNLTVEMAGTFVAPDSATGNAVPRNIIFTLTGISMREKDTQTEVAMLENATTTVTVINRPQIIFEKNVKSLKGTTYDQFTASFSNEITISGKFNATPLTQLDGTIVLTKEFTIEEAQGVKVTIAVNWKDIITSDTVAKTDTVTDPTYTTKLKLD